MYVIALLEHTISRMKIYAKIIAFVFPGFLNAQQNTTCIFYNIYQEPYRIEQRLIDSLTGITTYISHAEHDTYKIEIQTRKTGDTIVIEKSYYSVFRTPTRRERMMNSGSYSLSFNTDFDSVTLGFGIYNGEEIDTAITGAYVKQYDSLIKTWKTDRFTRMLDSSLTVRTDSCLFLEKSVYTYVNQLLVSRSTYNEESKRTFYIFAYQVGDTTHFLSHDRNNTLFIKTSAFHGTNPTNLIRITNRLDWKKTYVDTVFIPCDTSVIFKPGYTIKYKCFPCTKNLIISSLAPEEPLFRIKLLEDEELIEIEKCKGLDCVYVKHEYVPGHKLSKRLLLENDNVIGYRIYHYY